MDKTTQTPTRRVSFTGTTLKTFACISMLLDHIGASCILAGLYPEALLGQRAVLPMELYIVYRLLRWVGRLAFPIYCFLLAEGFVHTHSVRRYAARLAVFALVSELPFDWAFYRQPFYWGHQNVYWTLLFGVAAMVCLRWGEQGGGWRRFAGVIAALAIAGAAELIETDYGFSGVVLIAALYYLREKRPFQCLAGAALVSYELPAPLAFVPVWLYNGERGACTQAQKWAFYLFYPVHLVILGLVTNLVIGVI